MKEKFIIYSLACIEKKKIISDLERKKLKYGLEGFYNLITKTIVLFGLALIFNLLKELILLILIYSSFRLYGFGIHAKTSLQCWFTTIPIYIGGCFIIKYVTISRPFVIGIYIIGMISFLLFAPADTPARPLIHKQKRIRAKIFSLLILIGYIFLNHFYYNPILLNTTLYALLIECVSINPLTYKMFDTSFNNYRNYKKQTA